MTDEIHDYGRKLQTYIVTATSECYCHFRILLPFLSQCQNRAFFLSNPFFGFCCCNSNTREDHDLSSVAAPQLYCNSTSIEHRFSFSDETHCYAHIRLGERVPAHICTTADCEPCDSSAPSRPELEHDEKSKSSSSYRI